MKLKKIKTIKTILIVSFLTSLTLLGYLYLTKNKTQEAEAGWWNDSWMYRKSITVSNSSGGILTDFQVKILDNKDLSTDITAGKIQADLDDLRFTDINGTVLPYWIEDSTTSSVDVWVKMSNIPTTGATVYFYYGNAQAGSEQNGNNVFEFFDDFNGRTTLNPSGQNYWEVGPMGQDGSYYTTNGSAYVQSGVLNIKSESSSKVYNVFNTQDVMQKFRLDGSMIWEYRANWADYNGYSGINSYGINGSYTSIYAYLPFLNNGNTISVWKNPENVYPSTGAAAYLNNWYTVGTTNTQSPGPKVFLNGSLIESAGWATPPSSNNPSGKGLGFHFRVWSSTPSQYDWARVRKYASTDPTAGTPATEEKGGAPVASWSFDEGTGTIANDSSSNRNNGTLTNMASSADPNSGWQNEDKCVSGKCLAFDGTDDYVTYSDSPSLSSNDGLTFSAWVKINNLSGWQDIVNKYDMTLGQRGYMLSWNHSNYPNKITFTVSSTGASFTGGIINSTYTPVAGKWFFIEAVMSNSQMKIFIDGVDKTGTYEYGSQPSGLYDNNRPFLVGCGEDNGSKRNYLKGFIDEPRIYNYARTASQISKDYNAGLSGMGKTSEGTSASIGGKSNSWLTNGLVGHWKMDEASWNGTAGEVKDASGNGNNGTASGGATTGAGKYGNGGSFDGIDDYATIPSSSNYNFNSTNFTISTWFKTTNLSSANQILFNSSPHVRFALAYNHSCHSGTLAMYLSSNASSWDISTCSYGSKNNFVANQWYNITLTWDGLHYRVFVDGVLDIDLTSSLAIYNDSPSIRLGYSTGSEYLRGGLDEFRIYRRALSPKEVSDLYNYAPGPIGYWNLDDATGTTAKDLSGNGRNMSFTNSPSWFAGGKFNTALDFDNDDYASNDWTDFTLGPQTIEFWMRADSINTSYRDLVGTTLNTDWNRFHLQNSDNSIIFYAPLGVCSGTDSDVVPTVGEWYHVAGTTDGANTKVYINGQLKKTSACTTSGYTSTGIFVGGTTEDFDGQIDDVKIYNYARTQKQIVEDMSARGGSASGGNGSQNGSQVGYWKFDEGNGTTAYNSGNGGSALNGTISGATWSNEAKFGKALSFDGSNDYVDMGNSFSPTAITMSAWVKTSASGEMYVLSKGYGGSVTPFAIRQSATGNKIRVHFYSSGTEYNSISNSTINDGQWHYVAGSIDANGSTKIYIDGKIEASDARSLSLPSNTNPISVGARNDGTSGSPSFSQPFFNGLIDEVKIYPYALTDSEIQLDYNQGKSMVLGSKGTESDGKTPSNSASRAYCPPGNVEGNCAPGLSPAPVGEWNFEEGSGTTAKDTSGNNNTGTLTGGATWNVAGKKGGAASFSSGSKISKDGFSNNFNNSITLEAWIKRSSHNPNGAGIISRTSLNSNYGDFELVESTYDGRMVFSINGNVIYALADSVLIDNIWTHITGVYDGSNLKLYINGQLKNTSGNYTSNINNSHSTLVIGQFYNNGFSFNGQIDEVKIYNYARTPAQIAWDYNRGAPVGWWRMDDGQGSTAKDYSGNGNNGTLTNMDPTTDWVAGKNNGALDFDGSNDYVSIPNISQYFSGKSEISVSFWVKNRGSYIRSIINFSPGSVFSIENITGGSTPLRIYFNNNNPPEIPINLDEWTHITATFYNGTVKGYKNGVLTDTKTNSSSTIGSASGNLLLGIANWASALCANMVLDDVRIYNYALSAEQVKQVMNDGAMNFR